MKESIDEAAMKESEVNDDLVDENPIKICPYLQIECHPICPGWIAVAEDCLFHVCMSEIEEVFVGGARYLDEHLGLVKGAGMKTFISLRDVITGEATDEQKEIVRKVLGSLVSTGVLQKLSTITVPELSSLISRVESRISFAFDGLFEDGENE